MTPRLIHPSRETQEVSQLECSLSCRLKVSMLEANQLGTRLVASRLRASVLEASWPSAILSEASLFSILGSILYSPWMHTRVTGHKVKASARSIFGQDCTVTARNTRKITKNADTRDRVGAVERFIARSKMKGL